MSTATPRRPNFFSTSIPAGTESGRSALQSRLAYYLLTATPVFTGRTAVEVCSQHLQTAPVPPSKRLGRPLPQALEDLTVDLHDRRAG